MKILCWLGFHFRWNDARFFPSISAPIVEKVIFSGGCLICTKKNYRTVLIWDSKTRNMQQEK